MTASLLVVNSLQYNPRNTDVMLAPDSAASYEAAKSGANFTSVTDIRTDTSFGLFCMETWINLVLTLSISFVTTV